MSELNNRHWTATSTSTDGFPNEGNYQLSRSKDPEPAANQLCAKTIYLSMDPYQWIRRRAGLEKPGDVCHGRTVSQVTKSRIKGYQEGDFIFNTNGWQDCGLTGKDISIFDYMRPRKIDPSIAPISTALGVLGILGLTAYAGVFLQCQPNKGETVVISAAAGGVGQIAGQIAKLNGCHVVGIAGSDEKCHLLTDSFNFDAAVNYKALDFGEQLLSACPDGIDIYFENVGGNVFKVVKELLNINSRITLCGLISMYGDSIERKEHSNKNIVNALDHVHQEWLKIGGSVFSKNNVKVHNLAVPAFINDYETIFLSQMAEWIQDGLITFKHDLWIGLENAPSAFIAMFSGANVGKTLVEVSKDMST